MAAHKWPEEAKKIPQEQIASRLVFTNKNEVARANNLDLPLAPKARLVVREVQQSALGRFRRDGTNRFAVRAASGGVDCTLEEVESSLVTWKLHTSMILCVMPPKEGLPGVPPGGLLKPNRHIYGFTDAGRASGASRRRNCVTSASNPRRTNLRSSVSCAQQSKNCVKSCVARR